MRSTLSDVRFKTRTPIVLNLCRTDARVVDYVNEAQRLLLDHGHWWLTVQKWRICSFGGCVTLPCQLSTIERAAVCHSPVPVHDMWFEFLDHGWGTAGSEGSFQNGERNCAANCCGIGEGANYIGNFPSFDDVRGLNKKLNVTCDLASDVGKKVLLLGYDENLNWIRTEQDGVISDGEIVLQSQSAGTDSTHLFSSLTDIQFPDDRDGQTWLFEHDVDNDTRRLIGSYFYYEQRPSYARYRVSGLGLGSRHVEGETNGGCRKTLIEVLAKIEFVPVKNDNDYLVIGNLTAIKDGCLAIRYAEPPADMAKSEMFLQRALRALDLELNAKLGSGRKIGANFEGTGYGEPVANFL